jgi:hypothetical protein
MPLHYVTGSAGAGTTAAARELSSRRLLTYDTDDQDRTGMFGWFSRSTGFEVVGYNQLAITKNILDDQIWRPSVFAVLKLTMESQIDLVYVCGNLEEPESIVNIARDSEGKLVFLSVSDDTVRSRLEARASDPDAPLWGKQDWQRDVSVAANRATEERYLAMGAIILNGEQPIEDVADDIVRVTR